MVRAHHARVRRVGADARQGGRAKERSMRLRMIQRPGVRNGTSGFPLAGRASRKRKMTRRVRPASSILLFAVFLAAR
jgi:hypothetical protein